MRRDTRLRKGAEFNSVYEKGTVYRGPFFVLRVLANEAGHPRWGIAVGKRMLRSAVDRNRQRRRLRGAIDAAGLAGSRDVILTAKHGALTASHPDLVRSLRKLALRAGLEAPER